MIGRELAVQLRQGIDDGAHQVDGVLATVGLRSVGGDPTGHDLDFHPAALSVTDPQV